MLLIRYLISEGLCYFKTLQHAGYESVTYHLLKKWFLNTYKVWVNDATNNHKGQEHKNHSCMGKDIR